MPTQLYRRVKRERLVTYALWLAMVGLLAWGVVAWVGYLSERAEVAERRAAQAERQADHMAELLAESERTQDHLAELVASLEAQRERTRAQRERFRQDVNAILERLGIEVREHAESSSGPPGGGRTSSVTLPGEDDRVRRTLRVPSGDLDLSPDPPRKTVPGGETRSDPPREADGQPDETPQRDPPAPEPKPKPAPKPKPEPQPAVRPTDPSQTQPDPRDRPPQATGPAEQGPPDHAQGGDKPKERPGKAQDGARGAPDHAQGNARGQADGPPGHANAKGKPCR